MNNLCLGTIAVQFLANHPGKTYSYGELFAALRIPGTDKPLPSGAALMQRLNEKIKSLAVDGIVIQKTHTERSGDGCIKRVYYKMTRENAAKWQTRRALEAARERAKTTKRQDVAA